MKSRRPDDARSLVPLRLVTIELVIVGICSCTTFSNVRSAEIHPGLSTELQGAPFHRPRSDER